MYLDASFINEPVPEQISINVSYDVMFNNYIMSFIIWLGVNTIPRLFESVFSYLQNSV